MFYLAIELKVCSTEDGKILGPGLVSIVVKVAAAVVWPEIKISILISSLRKHA